MKIPGLDAYKQRWGIGTRSVIEPGLERMKRVLEQLGHPEHFNKIIHVAGTNGKGSTIAFLKALCESHSIRYGAFQSPAILDVHDQIVVNGTNIIAEQLDAIMQQISQADQAEALTDFELITICAFMHFQQSNLDVWLIETGMGGRLDSTNVISQSTTVITSLSIDHTNFLGTTLDEIGEHKAGIIKPSSKVFLPESIYLPPFEKEAELKNAELIKLKPLVGDVEISLLGKHQRMNATLAVESLSDLFGLSPDKILVGLSKAYIPYRMEKIADNLYLDGAHNVAAAEALVEAIRTNFEGKPIHIIMGILKDKDYEQVVRTFEGVADKITFVDFSHERALESIRLVEICRLGNKSTSTIDELQKSLLIDDKYSSFITGSLYFLCEWAFKNRN